LLRCAKRRPEVFAQRATRLTETRLQDRAGVDVVGQAASVAPMNSVVTDKLRGGVRDVPDFPKKGIVFKDITPLLSDHVLFRASIDLFLERCRGKEIDKIVGIDARGFLFGSAVAYELGVGFVPIRKRGKLPYKTEIAKYSLEYGEAEMEMHVDAMMRGERVVLVDDLLATGGTSAAAAALIRKAGGQLLEAQFLIELEFLNGRKQLEPTPVISFLKY
jgi:adenine phosphoribosyltransferase